MSNPLIESLMPLAFHSNLIMHNGTSALLMHILRTDLGGTAFLLSWNWVRKVCLSNGTLLIDESKLLYSNGEPSSTGLFSAFILEVVLHDYALK